MQGLHLTGDLFNCACPLSWLRDSVALRQACIRLATDAGLTVVGEQFHTFADAGGVTGLVLLADGTFGKDAVVADSLAENPAHQVVDVQLKLRAATCLLHSQKNVSDVFGSDFAEFTGAEGWEHVVPKHLILGQAPASRNLRPSLRAPFGDEGSEEDSSCLRSLS